MINNLLEFFLLKIYLLFWVIYSKGRFGFSVQKKIFDSVRQSIDLFKNRRIDVNNNGNKLTAIIVENQEKGKLKRFCEMNLQNKQ
ncbi:MAG: GUN4 domain-containing protein [Cyanobacteria bacterium J06649_11]